MTVQLTDMQRGLLNAAAQRDDRLLTPTLKGGAATKVAAKLLGAGLVREIAAKDGAPIWRRDGKTNQVFGLKLTAAGLKSTGHQANPSNSSEGSKIETDKKHLHVGNASPAEVAVGSEARSPREGTKISKVIGLLRRKDGATIEELVKATGWLPHTTRAALTGLRKRGFTIESGDREAGPRSYAVVTPKRDAA